MTHEIHPERTIHPADTRKPVAGHLRYVPGVDTPNPMEPMGPNALGERIWPVTIERTETHTIVGFAYAFPADVVQAALDEAKAAQP